MRTQFSDFLAKNVFSVSWWHQPVPLKSVPSAAKNAAGTKNAAGLSKSRGTTGNRDCSFFGFQLFVVVLTSPRRFWQHWVPCSPGHVLLLQKQFKMATFPSKSDSISLHHWCPCAAVLIPLWRLGFPPSRLKFPLRDAILILIITRL
jgi:hypothetical protein